MGSRSIRSVLPGSPPPGAFRALRLSAVRSLLVLMAVLIGSRDLSAVDDENCLMCHRFRGLARVDRDGAFRLFFVDEELFGKGPHARVSCMGCHADITQIPHESSLPVDCLRACHIEEPNREILFSHAGVGEVLSDSVHARGDATGSPVEFKEDFPECKDCHDEPLFRPVSFFKGARAGVSERALGRCRLCHLDEEFVRYYYHHVTTRLHKARDPREVVAMCGSCHADPALARRHGLPDVVSSYLETYHGKAVMFGSKRAPDCMDCHVREGASVHAMHSKDDARSSVHPTHAGATCATPQCHPAAAPALAGFDVHATRNPRTHPLEFSVAFFFVFATLAVLLPILTLCVLGLIRELFPSHEAEKELEQLAALARRRAGGARGIRRFSTSQRVQHAILIACFVILCLTGFPMRFAETSWAPVVFEMMGGIEVAPILHRVAGVILTIGFALHGVSILLHVRRVLIRKGERGLNAWIRELKALPMIPKWKDLHDLIQGAKYVLFLSPRRPKFDRFSWKEKLEYLGLFWGIPLLGVTGVMLWSEEFTSQVLPGWTLNVAYLAHTYESFLAVAHITLVHLPGILGRPGATPITGMLFGWVTPHVLADEHGGQVERWRRPAKVKP